MLRALAILLVLAAVSRAWGSEYHYNDVFLGVRATGLGGTLIGLADDPSAAWYNPAGLAHATHETVSLSASALHSKVLTLRGYLGSDLDVDSTAAFSPASLSTAPFLSGRLAFGAVTPAEDAYRVHYALEGPRPDLGLVSARMSRERSDSTYLVGLAYGQEVGQEFDLGVGVYYVFRNYREHRSDFRHQSTAAGDGSVAFQRTLDEQGVSHGAMLVLGLVYHPGGEEGAFRLGVTARTGANVSNSASLEEQLFVGFPDGADGTGLRYERRDSVARRDSASRIPPSLGLGVSYRLMPRWRIAVDGTIHGFVEYQDLGRTITKLATGNASVGTEFDLVDAIVVRAGAFTNRTSAPRESSATDLRPDSFDQYGGTLGCTFAGDYHSISVAAKVALMNGTGTVPSGVDRVETLPVSGYEVALVFGGNYYF